MLVIGWGNPLRGDDGFGFVAAERIERRLRGTQHEVLAVHQLTPELMDPISRADVVVFIDASEEGQPGKLIRRDVAASAHAAAFTHHASPAGLLAGAKLLYGATPQALLYTVRGQDFEFGQQLSGPVERAVDELVEIVSSGPAPGV